MTTRAKNWILRPYLDSAHWIEEESTILVTDTFCVLTSVICKGKTFPLQAWTGPEGSRRLKLPDFKIVSLWRWSALRTGRLYPPWNIPGTHFCQPQGLSAVGRIMSMKNSTDTIGNRTSWFDSPQSTAPPRATLIICTMDCSEKIYSTLF